MTIPTLREAVLMNFYSAERRAGACPIQANERMGEFAARLDALQDNMSAEEFERRLLISTEALNGVAL